MFFRTHIFGGKTLQFPLNLSKLIINEYHLCSIGFKSIRVGLTIDCSLIKDRHSGQLETLATHDKDLLKLNNTMNTCLIRLIIILYYSLSLNICEYLVSQIDQ